MKLLQTRFDRRFDLPGVVPSRATPESSMRRCHRPLQLERSQSQAARHRTHLRPWHNTTRLSPPLHSSLHFHRSDGR